VYDFRVLVSIYTRHTIAVRQTRTEPNKEVLFSKTTNRSLVYVYDCIGNVYTHALGMCIHMSFRLYYRYEKRPTEETYTRKELVCTYCCVFGRVYARIITAVLHTYEKRPTEKTYK